MRYLAKISLILLIGLGSLLVTPEVQARSINDFDRANGLEHASEQESMIQIEDRQMCLSLPGAQGLKQCKRVLAQDRSDFQVWNRTGRLFFELEDYDRAYMSFMYATHLRGDYAIAWANMCAALSQLQSYEQALDACNQSLNVSFLAQGSIDEKILALNNKSIALYLLGRYQEALETSEQALVLRPDDSQANINREFTLHALSNETAESDVKSFT